MCVRIVDMLTFSEQRSAYEHVVAKGFLGALNLKSQDIDVRGVPSADLNVDEDSMPISITRDGATYIGFRIFILPRSVSQFLCGHTLTFVPSQ